MAARIQRLRALRDNYCFLLHDENSRTALVIDPGEAPPVERALKEHGLELSLIVNTHHHHDHIGGNAWLKDHYGAEVFCSAYDLSRIPSATRGLVDNELVNFAGLEFRVLSIPGHTQGQIALHFEKDQALFAGDTLFEMGCGRLFEGTPEQMWASLAKLKKLDGATRLFFGHEYTEPANAVAIAEVVKAARTELGRTELAPVPTLGDELKVNPFLRAKDLATFTEWRELRNAW
jgi:hydroxyacylglutathione hydrolase